MSENFLMNMKYENVKNFICENFMNYGIYVCSILIHKKYLVKRYLSWELLYSLVGNVGLMCCPPTHSIPDLHHLENPLHPQ